MQERTAGADSDDLRVPTAAAVASPHVDATEAGEGVLRRGGNAIDAAIATAAALCVVYPNNVALGSDLVALVRSPDGSTRVVNATGPAPGHWSRDAMTSRYGKALPLRGVDTITVPGAVRGWEALHGMGGRLPWAELLTPAVALARSGTPVSRSVAAAVQEEEIDLARDPGCSAIFLPGGRPLRQGDPLRQPGLAESLQAIADGGAHEFYTGELARRWVSGLRGSGSVLGPDDLEAFRPEVVDPIRAVFGPLTVVTSPPNTQGFALLRVLTALGGAALHDDPDRHAGTLARAFDDANTVRDSLLADPRFADVDAARLMDPGTAPGNRTAPGRASGDTVGVSVVSADGSAVSLVQSVFHGFGACVLEPATGILFQNRGTSFSLDPRSPNVLHPGKRPLHTLMPVQVLRGDDVAWVSSTMGGQAQPQIHAQVLLRSFAGAPPAEAVAAPRWVVRTQPGAGSTVLAESDLSAAARDALERSGLPVRSLPPRDEWMGHANLVHIDPAGAVTAGSDPRADGSAVVVDA